MHQELVNRIVRWLRVGQTLDYALQKEGVPLELHEKWMALGKHELQVDGTLSEPEDPLFADYYSRIKQNENEAELYMLEKIQDNKSWQAQSWLLERTRKDSYERDKDSNQAAGLTANIQIVIPDNGRNDRLD